MATEVVFPKIGFSMNEGVIQEWLANNGEAVTEGQALFVIESEKSAQEIEAPASGILTIFESAGETLEVGQLIARID